MWVRVWVCVRAGSFERLQSSRSYIKLQCLDEGLEHDQSMLGVCCWRVGIPVPGPVWKLAPVTMWHSSGCRHGQGAGVVRHVHVLSQRLLAFPMGANSEHKGRETGVKVGGVSAWALESFRELRCPSQARRPTWREPDSAGV